MFSVAEQVPGDWSPGTAVDVLQGSGMCFRPDRVVGQNVAAQTLQLASGRTMSWGNPTVWRRVPGTPPWPAYDRHPLAGQLIRNHYARLAHAMHVAQSTPDPHFWTSWEYDPDTFGDVQELPEVVHPSSLDDDLHDQLPLFMRGRAALVRMLVLRRAQSDDDDTTSTTHDPNAPF